MHIRLYGHYFMFFNVSKGGVLNISRRGKEEKLRDLQQSTTEKTDDDGDETDPLLPRQRHAIN